MKKKTFVFKRYAFYATQGRFGDNGEWIPIDSSLWGGFWPDVKDRDGEMAIVTSGDPQRDTWVDIRFEDGKRFKGFYSGHLEIF